MKKFKVIIAGCLVATLASAADLSTTTGLDPNTPWIEVLHQLDNNTTVAAAFAARLAVSGIVTGANVSTFLGTPSSANLASALTTKTGTGTVVFSTSPTVTTPLITTSIRPSSDDGAALGDTTHNFSDLFLATGAVLNYANGNVAITHSSGILTMGTGELRITTAGTNAASVPTLGSTSTLTNKTLTTPTVTTPVITTGLTASGSASNDFSGSTGTFKTSTGATTVGGAFIGATDTRSGPGAISVTTLTTKLTTTGVADALTLANGVDGQIKIIVHDVDGGSGALVPTTKTGFTTITFTNVGESCTLIYVTTRGWMILALNGAVAT